MALTFTKAPPSHNLTGNPVKITVATDTVGVVDHYILLKIYSYSFDVDFISSKLQVIDGRAEFDIAEYMKKEQSKMFTFYYNSILNIHNFINTFSVVAYELYNNDGIEHEITPAVSSFAGIQGGIGTQLLKQFESTEKTFSSFFVETPRFLTWMQRDYKITSRTAEERLYFVVFPTIHLKIKIDLLFDDNSSQTVTVYTKYGVQDQIYEINSSFKTLGIGSYETATKKITKYSVFVTKADDSEYLNDKFTYLIDEKYYNKEVQFFFKNSFGCYDTLVFRGAEEQDNEFKFDIVQNIERFRTNIISEEIHQINTGWMSNLFKDCKRASQYLKELFLSNDIYTIDENNNIVKIIITNKKQKTVFKDGEYLYSFDIEYLTAEQEKFYSEIQEYELPNCFMVSDELGNPVPFQIREGCFKITNP